MFIHVLFKIFFRPLSLPFGSFEQFEGFAAFGNWVWMNPWKGKPESRASGKMFAVVTSPPWRTKFLGQVYWRIYPAGKLRTFHYGLCLVILTKMCRLVSLKKRMAAIFNKLFHCHIMRKKFPTTIGLAGSQYCIWPIVYNYEQSYSFYTLYSSSLVFIWFVILWQPILQFTNFTFLPSF